MVLTLQICAEIGRRTSLHQALYKHLHIDARSWMDWSALFKELLVQDRIWDFKDLFVAAVAEFPDSADELFFGEGDIKHSLLDDWNLTEEVKDESTNLAQLDLLLEPDPLRPLFLDEAKSRAQAIITHSPAAMKSRPFIRWIITNTATALSNGKKRKAFPWVANLTHLQDFPGLKIRFKGWYGPTVYVPMDGENPGWVTPKLSNMSAEPLQLALNLAKELKDYKSQVMCYKLLILQCEDPTQLFQELGDLQRLRQGDKQGYLENLLSSYLVCKERPAKGKLLKELEQTDDSVDINTVFARDVIERAVKRSLEGRGSTARLRNPTAFYMGKGLPWEAEQFLRDNFAELDGLRLPLNGPDRDNVRKQLEDRDKERRAKGEKPLKQDRTEINENRARDRPSQELRNRQLERWNSPKNWRRGEDLRKQSLSDGAPRPNLTQSQWIEIITVSPATSQSGSESCDSEYTPPPHVQDEWLRLGDD